MADRWNKAENDAVYRDRAAFGGQANQYDPRTGQMKPGSAQGIAQNYTGLGQAAAQRGAYQNNWAQADQSRGSQGAAMNLMQSAAHGQQPSQAQQLGRNMIDQSLNAQMAAAASARGGSLAQAAAMRQAQTMGDASRQQGMNQLSALRAQEMAQARGDYFGAASGMRQQDIGQQGMNMQSELAQRQLNQQGQQFYDQLGFNATRADQEGAMHRAGLDSQEYMAQKQMDQHSTDRETGVIGSVIGGIGSAVGSFFSDMRAKTDMVPLSAADAEYLKTAQAQYDGIAKASDAQHAADQKARAQIGGAMQAGFGGFAKDMSMLSDPRAKAMMPMSGPAPASFDKAGPGGMDVMGSLKAHSDFGTKFRSNPTGGMMMSDDRAKLKDAYLLGRSHQSTLESTGGFAYQNNNDWLTPEVANDKDLYRAAMRHRGLDKREPQSFTREMVSGRPVEGGPLAQAARSMEPAAYRYKPEHVEPGRDPNEVFVGPADAKKMEQDPVAGTAVGVDPQTSMRVLDKDKLLRLNSAIVANQQKQIDSLAAAAAKRRAK